MEKILANHISDKGLVTILYQCNDKRKNNSVMKLLCNLFMGLKNFKERVEPSNALTALTNSAQARLFSSESPVPPPSYTRLGAGTGQSF